MDSHLSMKITEICKVSPAPGDSPAPKSLPLTFFDLLWLRFHPVQRLFFYEISSAEVSFIDDILPKLKTSLALALRPYLPLAASLVWPQDYNIPTLEFVEGDGVSVTVAESGAEFYDVSSNRFREVEEYHGLVPQLSVGNDRAAVIAIQVTVFGDKGFSIGMTNHHAVVDGRTSTSFFKLWAHLCSLDHVVGSGSSIPTTDHPFYDRSVIDDSPGLAAIYANAWLNEEGPNNKSLNLKLPKASTNLFRYTLELSRQNLQSLKQWILRQQDDQLKNSHISSFALATAYFCVCTAKSEGLSDGKLEFSFAADARCRLKPPLPSNYFGNCLSGSAVSLERSELLSENGMFVACEAISKAVKGLEKEAFKRVELWCSYMVASCDKYEDKIISVAGSPRFEVYSADFGWGKPRKVEVVSAESPLTISLTDSRNGDGGMEIGLVKEKHEIEKFAAIFVKGLECL